MRAWVVRRTASIDDGPLELIDRPAPEPTEREVRVRVLTCGVCRTDLHLAEGDLQPPSVATGARATRWSVSSIDSGRVSPASAWAIASASPGCAPRAARAGSVVRGNENLCLDPRFTGWDADGGYAEHAVIDERYAYRLPVGYDDDAVAPLLCGGIIGYRALRRAALRPGGRLGIYGFGTSAHLAAQVAIAQGAEVFVMTGSAAAVVRRASSARRRSGDTLDRAARDRWIRPSCSRRRGRSSPPRWARWTVEAHLPSPGSTSPTSLVALRRSPLRGASGAQCHRQHPADGEALFALAAEVHLQVETTAYPLSAVDSAFRDLAHDRVTGAAVIRVATHAEDAACGAGSDQTVARTVRSGRSRRQPVHVWDPAEGSYRGAIQ